MNFARREENDSKKIYFGLKNAFSVIFEEKAKISGIYLITNINNDLVYIGQSKNLSSRLSTHLSGKYEQAGYIYLYLCDEEYLDIAEQNLIHTLKPIDNVMCTKPSKGYNGQGLMPLEYLYDYKNNFEFVIDVYQKILFSEKQDIINLVKSINRGIL